MPNLGWVPLDLEISDVTAKFRAEYLLKMPDAIEAATAAQAHATGFVTNDSAFKRVLAFETLQFDDLLK